MNENYAYAYIYTYVCNVQLYVTINHRAELNIELNSMHKQQDCILPETVFTQDVLARTKFSLCLARNLPT